MAKTEEKAVGTTEQPQIVVVYMDKSDETVLNLNRDKSIVLEWDPNEFRQLPAEVVDNLRTENLKNYVIAETRWKDGIKKKAVSTLSPSRLDPLSMHAEYRQASKEPKNHMKEGWHLYWAAPEEDFDRCMASGYRQVRALSNDQKALFEKTGELPPVGEENGEVVKLMTGDGKVELILLEIRQKIFEEHNEFVAMESQQRLGITKEKYFSAVDELNRSSPRKTVRAKALDGDKEIS